MPANQRKTKPEKPDSPEKVEASKSRLMKLRAQPKTDAAAAPAPPRPITNPLRVELYSLSPERKADVRNMLLAALFQKLSEMSASDVQDVAEFVEIKTNFQGNITPAEDFILALTYIHIREGLTPEYAAEKLEEFRVDFADALDTTRRFNATYAEMVKAATETPQQNRAE